MSSPLNILPIVILNWNSFDDTKECIESILETNPKNIIIYLLDNGSAIDDVKALKSKYENHSLIELRLFDKNLGFTKAHNSILEELLLKNYEYVFLLNNDTIIEKSCINNIQNLLSLGEVDMISCKMINYFERERMDNAGHRLMSSGEIIPKFHNVPISSLTQTFQNIGPCAGAGIYSIKMLQDIGLFDEYFSTGYEDAEIGLRAIIAGYKSIFRPEIIVYHKMGSSIKKVFNYEYSLKIQKSIFYAYLKLIHWQIILIQIIPFIIRFLVITLVDIISLRFRHLKVQSIALFNILFKELGIVFRARKQAQQLNRISWKTLFSMQESTLARDYRNFIKYIIRGEKSYFEKY